MENNMDINLKVILIGGSPMSGKSTLARKLSSYLGYANISTDDIGEVLQTAVDINPMKGFDYREYYIKKTEEELKADTIDYHLKLYPAIERLIEVHYTWGSPIIIEGWALYPSILKNTGKENIKKLWIVCTEAVFTKRLNEDIGFYKGTSDEELMKAKYLQRSLWHNDKIIDECGQFDENVIKVDEWLSVEKVFESAKKLLLG
jgi:2-phosphoglycerate kinase